jgi:hypothetical protein
MLGAPLIEPFKKFFRHPQRQVHMHLPTTRLIAGQWFTLDAPRPTRLAPPHSVDAHHFLDNNTPRARYDFPRHFLDKGSTPMNADAATPFRL